MAANKPAASHKPDSRRLYMHAHTLAMPTGQPVGWPADAVSQSVGLVAHARWGAGRRSPRGLVGRFFHAEFRDKNRRGIGNSQSKWTASEMETPGAPSITPARKVAVRLGMLSRMILSPHMMGMESTAPLSPQSMFQNTCSGTSFNRPRCQNRRGFPANPGFRSCYLCSGGGTSENSTKMGCRWSRLPKTSGSTKFETTTWIP
jgi:hypothetical protein